MTKSITIMALAASHTPDIKQVTVLTGVVLVAKGEFHVPCVGRSLGDGIRRPVGAQLHIDERMAAG
ncbi:hypothetical protein H8E77_04105 [bacterium]|nr:hypothetical protein [bacterium]